MNKRIANRFCLFTLLVLLAGFLCTAPVVAKSKTKAPVSEVDKEIELGKEAVKELEKECKLIDDEAVVNRVRSIGEKITSIAMTDELPAGYGSSKIAKFDYTFKVIDDKKVNAFCLPGGHIYVNSGLLDFVQSDHELAAVLAHEVAHAAHHHVRSLVQEQSKLHRRLALVLLAGLIGNLPQRDMSNILLGTQFFKQAKMSGYGQQAEKDADLTAVRYMMKTDYNPVGMLTFLERLNRTSDLVDLGILQTHPRVDDRITDVSGELKKHNVTIDRRKVTKVARAQVNELQVNGQTVCEIKIGDQSVLKLSGPKSRAEVIAGSINETLDGDITIKDVRVMNEQSTVVVKEQTLLQATQDDAALNGLSCPETCDRLSESIKKVLWKEMVDMIR